MSEIPQGIVYLVGAGPGDIGLMTLRGVECLRRADVVVYDNLANEGILRFAPAHAVRIYAGKKADQHTKSQDEINELLASYALEGKTVVRLKGGDPFLFGRGGEEAAYLIERGIRWEVVPGVTSAIAVPAYAGIPVTHRSVNGSLHIVTGHENVEGLGADLDWTVLARSRGTIVMLMGVKNLEVISTQLIKHGMDAGTPVALVQWGTRSEQKTLVSTLERVVGDVKVKGIRPPAVTVIGEVVRLRKALAWVERRPLFGVRVAVTRPQGENDDLTRRLEELGAEVIQTPTLQIVPLETDESGRRLMDEVATGGFDWLALTSANGVRNFMRCWLDAGYDARQLAKVRLAVIGRRTGEELLRFGLRADLVAAGASQEGLAETLVPEKPGRILVARAQEARTVLEERLGEAGIETEVLPVYRMDPCTTGIAHLTELLEAGRVHAVTFTSARTFTALADTVGEGTRNLLGEAAAAVLGPVTREALERQGVKASIVAEKAEMGALAEAICAWKNG